MAGQIGTALIEGEQLFLVKVAAVCESCVYRRASMSLRADKPVAPRHFGLSRVNVHFLKVQYCQQLHNGQAAAYMAYAQMTDAGHDIAADILAFFFKIAVQGQFPPVLIKRFN